MLHLSGSAFAQQAAADSASAGTKIRDAKAVVRDDKSIKLTQSLQLWDVYTLERLGDQVQETQNDLYIRRGRLGVQGSLQHNIVFNVAFAYDGIGRNKNTAGNGSPNPGDNHDFYLWEAFSMWKHKPLLNVTLGYFRPQVGREHMTAAFKTSSLEKSLSNFQPRAHTIARSTGRELGLNIGGLHLGNGWSFNYNLGFFDMSGEKLIGQDARSSPMLASRMAFTIGDPEMNSYGIGYTHSYYGKRKGITFGVNGTYQGKTQVFHSNSFYGADVLANWGPWDFTTEYDFLSRNSILAVDSAVVNAPTAASTLDRVLTYKLAYNFLLKNGKVLQAAGMYSRQRAHQYSDLEGLNALTGATDQQVYDFGINYLINKDNLKLNLHYVWGERADRRPQQYYAYLATGFQYLF